VDDVRQLITHNNGLRAVALIMAENGLFGDFFSISSRTIFIPVSLLYY
jgi:hypothetical protein